MSKKLLLRQINCGRECKLNCNKIDQNIIQVNNAYVAKNNGSWSIWLNERHLLHAHHIDGRKFHPPEKWWRQMHNNVSISVKKSRARMTWLIHQNSWLSVAALPQPDRVRSKSKSFSAIWRMSKRCVGMQMTPFIVFRVGIQMASCASQRLKNGTTITGQQKFRYKWMQFFSWSCRKMTRRLCVDQSKR